MSRAPARIVITLPPNADVVFEFAEPPPVGDLRLSSKLSWDPQTEAPAMGKGTVVGTFQPALEASYLRNCLIRPRKGEAAPLFYQRDDGTVVARLDGYAIVPIEDYESLPNSGPTPPPDPSAST